jgi:glutathione synthase/RimK-type ligase-like ATP-grasp enzyme
MKKINAIILSNEWDDDHNLWINACEEYKDKIEYRIVNLTDNSWLENVQIHKFDILLAKPGGISAPYKQLYDERIYILNKILDYSVYPSADEIFIYENKRFLSFWLKAKKIPHPRTDVFYDQKEALEFVNKQVFPLVGKANIGASGSGVSILNTRKEAINYLNQTFSGKGTPKRIGPNFNKGGIILRGLKYLIKPSGLIKKLKLYKTIGTNPQKGFVIFQEYISHDFEWRVVRIGDSFFAHKKIKVGEKASGSLLKEYENPPFALLDFVKEITDSNKFYSQAIDIFESERGYLVNEMQCIFGQSDPFQMLVNELPGRYLYLNNNWTFENGIFNTNECFNLRIAFILEKLSMIN